MNDMTLCADSSRANNEQLAGTGSRYDVWFLLEYRPNWHPKATKIGNNTITEGVAQYINAALETASNPRMLFIRQMERKTGPLRAYIVFSDELLPRAYALDLNRYEDLLSMPLADMLNGRVDEEKRVEEPFYAVCVHKERDRACGPYGWSVYNTLRSLAPGRVWQSTHIGGHRFAGTGLAFPHGTYYGHLDAEDAAAIVQAEGQGQMHLPKVRGRSCYAPYVQAADVALREYLGVTQYSALRMKSASETGENTWRVVFATRTGDTHTMAVTQTESAYEVLKSTTDEKPVHVSLYNATVAAE